MQQSFIREFGAGSKVHGAKSDRTRVKVPQGGQDRAGLWHRIFPEYDVACDGNAGVTAAAISRMSGECGTRTVRGDMVGGRRRMQEPVSKASAVENGRPPRDVDILEAEMRGNTAESIKLGDRIHGRSGSWEAARKASRLCDRVYVIPADAARPAYKTQVTAAS
jgi:hypothetical protein